jgi:hypothetical protein
MGVVVGGEKTRWEAALLSILFLGRFYKHAATQAAIGGVKGLRQL